MRQQHAIYQETQEVGDDPGYEAAEDYTADIDFSHTASMSIR
jgi:hypothetical protein